MCLAHPGTVCGLNPSSTITLSPHQPLPSPWTAIGATLILARVEEASLQVQDPAGILGRWTVAAWRITAWRFTHLVIYVQQILYTECWAQLGGVGEPSQFLLYVVHFSLHVVHHHVVCHVEKIWLRQSWVQTWPPLLSEIKLYCHQLLSSKWGPILNNNQFIAAFP